MKHEKSLRLISIILTLTMVITAFSAVPVFAEESAAADTVTDEAPDLAIDPGSSTDVTVVGEEEALRSETEKHFRMSDGSYTAVSYGTAVHHEQDGEWVDYDNTLVESAAQDSEDIDGYGPKNSDIKVKFAKKSNSSKILKLTEGDTQLSFSLNGSKNKVEAQISDRQVPEGDPYALPELSSTVTYENIFDDIDLVYELNGENIKENFVLHSNTGVYGFSFDIKVKNLTPSLDEEGNILFSNEALETVFTIPKGCMYDAAGEYSDDVEYTLTGSGKKYTLTVSADKEWIASDDRVFPVSVDPTIIKPKYDYEDAQTLSTQYYNLDTGTLYDNTGYMYLGIDGGIGEYAGRIKITSFPTLPDNTVVCKAYYFIKQRNFSEDGLSRLELTAYRATSDTTWYSSYNSKALDYVYDSEDSINEFRYLDITSAYLAWDSGTANYGITIRSTNHDWTQSLFANSIWYGCDASSSTSGAQPRLIVSYRNNVGTEGTYTYESYGAGRAGTVHVAHNSGQFTAEVPLLTSTSETHPYTLSLVYNTHFSDKCFTADDELHTASYWYMREGCGWKLNAQQSVVPVSLTSAFNGAQEEYVIYTDADGTEHYFKQSAEDASRYDNEDGSDLYITKNDNGWYYLWSEDGAYSSFDEHGYIRGTADKNMNKVVYHYTTVESNNKRLNAVKWTNVGGTAQTLATITYNGYYVSTITDEFGAVTTFNYTSDLLTSITRPDGTTTTITYGGSSTNWKMSQLYDSETHYGLQMQYASSANRLSQIGEYCYSGGVRYTGALNTFDYDSADRTTVTYCGDNAIKDTDASTKDDVQYITVFDHYGRTVCAYTYVPYAKKVYSASSAVYEEHENETDRIKNKVSVSASTGFGAVNMLSFTDFENAGSLPAGWYASSPSTGTVGISNTIHHTGYYSLKVTANSSSSSESIAYIPASGLTPGLSYTFSAYMKTSSLSTASTATGGAFLKAGGTYSRRYQLSTSSYDGGWQQISCTFTASSETVNLACGLSNCTGTVYFDNVQLVRHNDPPQISLASNGDMEDGYEWENSSNTGYSTAYSLSSSRALYVDGSPDSVRGKYQRIRIGRSSDSTYVLSGWAMAHSAPLDGENKLHTPTFGLTAHIRYYDGITEDHYIPFNSDVTTWQYVSAPIVPKESGKVVDYIDLIVTYNYNINTAYFDDISLVIESCASYKYNEGGKVVAVNATEESELTAQYTGTDITLLNDEGSGDYEYTYDSAHNVTSVTWDGITQTLSYNSGKLNTYTSLTAGGYTMWSSAEYNSTNDHLTSTVDATGRRVNYGYSIEDESTYKRTTQDPTLTNAGANISELYDAATGKPLLLDRQDGDVYIEYADGGVSAVTPIPNASYTTAQARLQSAASAANDGVSGYQYKYTYDKWGNLTKVTVGGKTLTEKTYDDTTGNLLTSLLPFGNTLSYTHDLFGRLEKISDADGNTLVSYDYDGLGNISTVTDNVGHLTTEAHYDSIGRLLLQIGYSWGTTRDRSISYTYDGQGRLSGRDLYFDGIGGSESYTYDSSGLVTAKVSASGDLYNVVYDAFNRVNMRVVNSGGGTILQRYEYALAHSDTCHTPLPVRVVYSDGTAEWTSAGATYDGAYNVTSLLRNTFTEATFTYDSAHRLSTATYSDGDTVSYSYDNRGNITSKTITENGTTRTISYGYGGTQADALKSYDGVNFTYNKYGYPTGYYNGDSYTFTWDTYGNLSGSTVGSKTAGYSYDASGMRKSKSVNGVTSTYYYDGDTLMLQKNSDGTSLFFSYNDAGDPVGFTRRVNGTAYNYYFITNLQGDVIQILDGNHDVVCNYYYDAWGAIRLITDADGNNITNSTNQYSVAYLNPIRYRGYYYDVETGFYYLQTRYYDPEIGRFISRDSYEYIGANGDIGSFNLFAYCSNNPVGRLDPTGEFVISTLLICAVVGIVTGGTVGGIAGNAYANSKGYTGWDKTKSILTGIGIGGFAGGALGYFVTPTVISASGVAGISLTSGGISTIAALGTSFGKLGILIANNGQQMIDWSKTTWHGMQRMIERGVSQNMVEVWIKTGKALQQAGDKILYVTKQGAVVIDKAGKVITAYTSQCFDSAMQEVVKKLFGK